MRFQSSLQGVRASFIRTSRCPHVAHSTQVLSLHKKLKPHPPSKIIEFSASRKPTAHVNTSSSRITAQTAFQHLQPLHSKHASHMCTLDSVTAFLVIDFFWSQFPTGWHCVVTSALRPSETEMAGVALQCNVLVSERVQPHYP